jgi:nucleoid-associated protein YgaU
MAEHPHRVLLIAAPAGAGLLLATAPSPGRAVHTLATAAVAADPLAPLVALVALAAWLLTGWVALAAVLTAGGRLPGLAGRVARGACRRIAPRALRRLLELALGLTVAAGTLGAPPAVAAPAPTPPPAVALDWPRTTAPSPGTSAPGALDWPASTVQPAAPATDPAPTPARSAAARRPVPVVVAPGDTLWGIAAARLGPGAGDRVIAQAWPAWWAANRATVGADPDLITPGLRLDPPDPTTTSTPTS